MADVFLDASFKYCIFIGFRSGFVDKRKTIQLVTNPLKNQIPYENTTFYVP